MKKLLCVFLSLTMLFSVFTPALAANSEQTDTLTVALSDTDTLVLFMDSPTPVQTGMNRVPQAKHRSFSVSRLKEGELQYKYCGAVGEDEIHEYIYENGNIVAHEVRYVSDYVSKISPFGTVPIAKASSTRIGYITCCRSEVLNASKRFTIYSDLVDTDNEAYTINADKDELYSFLVSVVLSIVGSITGVTTGYVIVDAIISAAGGKVIGDRISVAISDQVAVYASYYSLYGYDSSLNQYCDSVDGVIRRVTTKNSKYFDEEFYEGFTPKNWKTENFAYYIWYQFYDYSFPGVEKYA